MRSKRLYLSAIILLSLILLVGCADSVVGWKYNPDELRVGMTFNEVKDVWGEPSSLYISGEYTIWTYTDYDFKYSSRYESYTLTFINGTLSEWTIYRSTD